MKIKYKGLIGIAALKKKRADEKKLARPRKSWKDRRGMVTRTAEEMKKNGPRRDQRIQAKVFISDPLHYADNTGKTITARGVII